MKLADKEDKSMKKMLALVMALLMVVMAFAACGAKQEAPAEEPAAEETTAAEAEAAEEAPKSELIEEGLDGKDVKVGFVVKSLADQYWTLVQAGAKDAAAAYGCELNFIAPNSESDVQKQVENIETVTSWGANVICIAPSNDETVLPALQTAVDQGIKVIAVDTDSSLPDKASFIGTGNEAAAKEGAVWAAKQLGEGKKAIILRGRLGDATHDQREAGLKAGLEENGIEILETQAADSTEEKGMQIAENLLNKYDQVDLIITTADSMATGAMNAVEKGGYEGVNVYGFDGTIPGCQYTIEGKWLGTTAQSPYNMGVLGVTNAVKLAHGDTIEERIDSGQTVVGKDNAEEFLADLKQKAGE